MWVLVAVFIAGFNINTQQIGFYETKEACLAAAANVKSAHEPYAVYGECLPSNGMAGME